MKNRPGIVSRVAERWCRRLGLESFAEEAAEVVGVADAVVLVAVVHENLGLLHLVVELADGCDPLPKFCLAVQILEAFGGGDAFALPVLGVAAVEPDNRQVARGCGDNWGHGCFESLGF